MQTFISALPSLGFPLVVCCPHLVERLVGEEVPVAQVPGEEMVEEPVDELVVVDVLNGEKSQEAATVRPVIVRPITGGIILACLASSSSEK